MYVCMSIIYMNSQKVKVIQVVHGQRAGKNVIQTYNEIPFTLKCKTPAGQ